MSLALRVVFLFIFAIWIEQSLLPFLVPEWVSLHLVTLLVISLGFLRGSNVAAVTGFLFGTVMSLLTGEPLGLSSMALSCVGFSAGWMAGRLHLNLPGMSTILAIGLLFIEWAVTFVAGWSLYDIAYRPVWWNYIAAVVLSPAVFWLTRVFFARSNRAAIYG